MTSRGHSFTIEFYYHFFFDSLLETENVSGGGMLQGSLNPVTTGLCLPKSSMKRHEIFMAHSNYRCVGPRIFSNFLNHPLSSISTALWNEVLRPGIRS